MKTVNHQKGWTTKDDARLMNLIGKGLTTAEVAKKLGRTRASISVRKGILKERGFDLPRLKHSKAGEIAPKTLRVNGKTESTKDAKPTAPPVENSTAVMASTEMKAMMKMAADMAKEGVKVSMAIFTFE